MTYVSRYASPLGNMTMSSDGTALTGLWFDGQTHFGASGGKAPLDGAAEEKALPIFQETARWLDLYFQGKQPEFTPPVRLEGTAFQKRVWDVLLTIPYGETMTYGEIASRLGAAAQAVGGAVGRNPVSILVPCHRVVGTDGSLTGYAGGLEKKARLLALEKPGKYTTVFFDLDGTLTPMETDKFVDLYFSSYANYLTPHGYHLSAMQEAILTGIRAMVANEGPETNEEIFFRYYAEILGDKVYKDKDLFLNYYKEDFVKTKEAIGCNPKAAETVLRLKEKDFRVVLTTNPLFPDIAIETRIRWGGMEPSWFDHITTYEQYHHCKPNPDYYREVMDKLGLTPEECIMVGNNTEEDMIAKDLGLTVFLLTDCLLNPGNQDIAQYPNGNFDDLQRWLKETLSL